MLTKNKKAVYGRIVNGNQQKLVAYQSKSKPMLQYT